MNAQTGLVSFSYSSGSLIFSEISLSYSAILGKSNLVIAAPLFLRREIVS
jgi:hypothetical protein